MLVVDASCLFEVLTGSEYGAAVSRELERDPDHAAPHVVDVEVLGIVRSRLRRGALDPTRGALAISHLRDWAGERFSHRPLLDRAWQLRDDVRGWDAMYVALAEALDAPLVTADRRLAQASGPRCAFTVPEG
jgi:predicted nucleic acid-binding protein